MASHPSVNVFVQRLEVGLKTQTVWGINHAVWFFLMGVGGALFITRHLLRLNLGSILGLNGADIISLLAVVVGGAVLISDLGRPTRFMKALRNVRTSRISIGAICDFVFLAAAMVLLMPDLEIGGSRPFAFLPWGGPNPSSLVNQFLLAVAGISAFVVAVYAGFVLSFSASIPFWHTEAVPLQFLAYSFASTLGIGFIALPILGNIGVNIKLLEFMGILLLAACLVLTGSHIFNMTWSNPASRASVRMLIKGSLSRTFIGGVIVAGIIVPMLLLSLAYYSTGPVEYFTLAICGVLILAGGFLLRHSIMKAGIYAPALSF